MNNDVEISKNALILRLKRLASSYEEQCASIEDFARWNLPADIAEDWENIDYFLKVLLQNGVLTAAEVAEFEQIDRNFADASFGGATFDEAIWTHEGMQNHPFWHEQRLLAEKLLKILE